MDYLSYQWSILYGLYMYLIFQIMFLSRFGSINTTFTSLDIFIIAVGIISVIIAMYFANKLGSGRAWLLVPFLIALPFSYIGILSGGLFGIVGILIGGLLPFAVLLPLGYWLVKKFIKEERAAQGQPG